ncbi:hypothetical protein LPUS_12015 [Lasallia pustulata]|uniref:Uncharacterized protein n=1 Tax=Lasallia pustulata TaxID=136370 RepID=A0A1W5DD40_9LECA|nr:hypothetical protein LPUS_12015 [Lasallia pustulata]
MESPITLRPPTASALAQPPFTPPTPQWLSGTWHVTHSTLPMWKSKRNVQITYRPLPSADGGTDQGTDRIEDIVTYQGLKSEKIKSVNGVDKASATDAGAWDWRGKGWLMIASSHWEVLGYGHRGPDEWAVTYFAKTLFTPAGIDIYSRSSAGFSEETLEGITDALGKIQDPHVKKLAGEIFEVQQDGARSD